MTNTQRTEFLDQKLAEIREHFEHVQILTSWELDEGGTQSCFRGKGNWFARQGMAREFIERDQADTIARELGPVINPPNEDDNWKNPS